MSIRYFISPHWGRPATLAGYLPAFKEPGVQYLCGGVYEQAKKDFRTPENTEAWAGLQGVYSRERRGQTSKIENRELRIVDRSLCIL